MGKRALRWWQKTLRHVALFSGLSVALVACSATFTNHGYVPPAEELSEVSIGASRDAVVEAIGTPGSAGVMRDEAWFYTAYRVRNYAYQPPQVTERQILAVSFDGRGRVSNIEQFGLEDGRIVQLSRRVTTSSVQDIGFLRSVLRNFGRLDAGTLLNN